MQYDIQKHELTLDIHDSRVKLTFESDVPEISIWHYVFSALSEQKPSSIQPAASPLEQGYQSERSTAMNRVYCLYRVSDRGQVEKTISLCSALPAAHLPKRKVGRSKRNFPKKGFPAIS